MEEYLETKNLLEGDKQFQQGRFQEALTSYQKALSELNLSNAANDERDEDKSIARAYLLSDVILSALMIQKDQQHDLDDALDKFDLINTQYKELSSLLTTLPTENGKVGEIKQQKLTRINQLMAKQAERISDAYYDIFVLSQNKEKLKRAAEWMVRAGRYYKAANESMPIKSSLWSASLLEQCCTQLEDMTFLSQMKEVLIDPDEIKHPDDKMELLSYHYFLAKNDDNAKTGITEIKNKMKECYALLDENGKQFFKGLINDIQSSESEKEFKPETKAKSESMQKPKDIEIVTDVGLPHPNELLKQPKKKKPKKPLLKKNGDEIKLAKKGKTKKEKKKQVLKIQEQLDSLNKLNEDYNTADNDYREILKGMMLFEVSKALNELESDKTISREQCIKSLEHLDLHIKEVADLTTNTHQELLDKINKRLQRSIAEQDLDSQIEQFVTGLDWNELDTIEDGSLFKSVVSSIEDKLVTFISKAKEQKLNKEIELLEKQRVKIEKAKGDFAKRKVDAKIQLIKKQPWASPEIKKNRYIEFTHLFDKLLTDYLEFNLTKKETRIYANYLRRAYEFTADKDCIISMEHLLDKVKADEEHELTKNVRDYIATTKK